TVLNLDMVPSPVKSRLVLCQICLQEVPLDDAVPADLIRESILPIVKLKANPWNPAGFVSLDELNKARLEHVASLLAHPDADTEAMNREIFESVKEHELLAKNVDK